MELAVEVMLWRIYALLGAARTIDERSEYKNGCEPVQNLGGRAVVRGGLGVHHVIVSDGRAQPGRRAGRYR
jgi:hypothetical protein